MSVHLKPEETKKRLSPADLDLVYCSAERIELSGKVELESGEEELCLVCIAGEASYQCQGVSGTAVMSDMLYVPIQSSIVLEGENAAVSYTHLDVYKRQHLGKVVLHP